MRIRRGPATVTGDASRSARAQPPIRHAEREGAERVGPGARRPASGRSPQTLVERGWLHARISSFCPGLYRCRCLLAAGARARIARAAAPATVTVHVEGPPARCWRRRRHAPTPRPSRRTATRAHRAAARAPPARSSSATSGSWGGSWFNGLRLLGRNDPRRDARLRCRSGRQLLLELLARTMRPRRRASAKPS